MTSPARRAQDEGSVGENLLNALVLGGLATAGWFASPLIPASLPIVGRVVDAAMCLAAFASAGSAYTAIQQVCREGKKRVYDLMYKPISLSSGLKAVALGSACGYGAMAAGLAPPAALFVAGTVAATHMLGSEKNGTPKPQPQRVPHVIPPVGLKGGVHLGGIPPLSWPAGPPPPMAVDDDVEKLPILDDSSTDFVVDFRRDFKGKNIYYTSSTLRDAFRECREEMGDSWNDQIEVDFGGGHFRNWSIPGFVIYRLLQAKFQADPELIQELTGTYDTQTRKWVGGYSNRDIDNTFGNEDEDFKEINLAGWMKKIRDQYREAVQQQRQRRSKRSTRRSWRAQL